MSSYMNKSSAFHATMLAALALWTGVSLSQPVPGGPPPGASAPAGPPEGGFPVTPPLPANAPEPPRDPRNLEGPWYHEKPLDFQINADMFGYPVPFNAAGKKVMDRRLESLKNGTPFINASAQCLPAGQPWQLDLNMPFHIFQTQDRIDMLFEEYHGLVQISTNPAKPVPGGYMGHSVGHWDGDTLVVETTGYKDGIWLDVNGTPASKNAKMTQRIRKVKTDHWFLEIVFTIDDPTYYTRPWSWTRDYSWRPDMALFREYNCEEQTGQGAYSGLIPEPED